MAFGKKNEEIFLGREIQSHRDYSEETAQMIDHEVVSIIKNAQDTARKILEEKIDLLHLMAEELLEHETIWSFKQKRSLIPITKPAKRPAIP